MSKTRVSDSYFIICFIKLPYSRLCINMPYLSLNMLLSEQYVLCHVSVLQHNAKRKEEFEFEHILIKVTHTPTANIMLKI